MDIELRLLRSFVQIFESGSLSRAADRLACTQAAMSMRLKLLETELGAPLFIRQHHRLEPTLRGAELYASALGVLAAYDEMMSQNRSKPPRDRLRIGMPDDYALGFLAPVLRDFGAQLDRLEIEITCDLSANLMTGVQRQDLDLALVTLAARPAQSRAAVDVALQWLASPDYPTDRVRLAAYPEGCVFRRAMIAALETAASGWQIAVQSRSHAGIMAAVRAGVAVTSVAAGSGPTDLRAFASEGRLPALPHVPLYLVTAESARPAARRMEEALADSLMQRFAAASDAR